jgi:putative RNA 2'-phosphotransferase
MRDKKFRTIEKIALNILGHNPDEFAVVLEPEGWIKLKTLLMAMVEDAGLTWVSHGLLKQFFTFYSGEKFELNENSVRLRPDYQPVEMPSIIRKPPPDILYTPIRARAYNTVSSRGLTGFGEQWIVLSTDRDKAERLGRRREKEPVIVEVKASMAEQSGNDFYKYGKSLYLSKKIDALWIILPPLSRKIKEMERKRLEKRAETEVTKEQHKNINEPSLPGGFFLDSPNSRPQKKKTRKNEPGWKKERRRSRRR